MSVTDEIARRSIGARAGRARPGRVPGCALEYAPSRPPECPPLRLFNPAADAPGPRPVVVPIRVGAWPGRIDSWTAEQWARLADPPAGSFVLAGGVRMVLVIE